MKNIQSQSKWLLLICMVISVFSSHSYASEENQVMVKEQLFMSLDRSVYCVDELVYFRIFNTSSAAIKNVEWSSVVDVEIISPEGHSVARGKFPFSRNGAEGSLYLSANILSGNYYVSAYTKWMRNQPTEDYFYERIKIINPFKTSILTSVWPVDEKSMTPPDTVSSSGDVRFKLSAFQFGTNQKATLEITELSENSQVTDVCVSIVKKGSIEEGTLNFRANHTSTKAVTFIPELRGVTVSGKVLNKIDSLPVPFAKVWITMQTKETITRDLMCNNKGEFSIDLGKDIGNPNLFVNASSDNDQLIPIVLIDNDFAFSALALPFIPFTISENEKELIKDLSIKSQLNSIYNITSQVTDTLKNKLDDADFFYGTPDFSLKIKDFIALPTISDYFKELIPMVNIKKESKKKYFHVLGPYAELMIYDPLVMVDMVKIDNVDDILSISPSLLDRIDVVQIPYLRGDVTYGGIIHFISKENDFAQIELPDESIFVSYNLLDSLNKQTYNEPVQAHFPLVGNRLFWQHSLAFDDDKRSSIEFNTGSEPASYTLKIEGVDSANKPFVFKTDIVIE